MGRDLYSLPPWEALLKKVLWTQIGQLSNKRILDFGSGIGVTEDPGYHFSGEAQPPRQSDADGGSAQ